MLFRTILAALCVMVWSVAAQASSVHLSPERSVALAHAKTPVKEYKVAGSLTLTGAGQAASSGGAWTPASLGAALIVWYKADTQVYSDTGCTTAAVNAGNVNCVKDQSGNALNLNAGNNFLNPVQYNTTGLSGKPALEILTNSNAGLVTGISGTSVTGKWTSTTGSCFWAASASASSSSNGGGPGYGANGQGPVTGANSFLWGGIVGGVFSAAYEFNALGSISVVAGVTHIFGTTLSASQVVLYLDSTTPAATISNTFPGFTSPGDFILIDGTAFAGDIGEAFCTNTTMSSADISNAITYLTSRGW